jgi:hypothetical protein
MNKHAILVMGAEWFLNHQDTKAPRKNTKKNAEAQSRRGTEPLATA